MKKIIISLLLLALLAPAVDARPKKKKSGKVKDRVFSDAKYDFSLKLPQGWKYKTTKAKDNFRLILTKNNFEIPSSLREMGPTLPKNVQIRGGIKTKIFHFDAKTRKIFHFC